MFDAAIQSTQSVPQVERGVVDKIFWKGVALLESVGKAEPYIQSLRTEIEQLIEASLLPLSAYAREYDQFIEFHMLKIEDALAKFNLDEMDAKEIKAWVIFLVEAKILCLLTYRFYFNKKKL